jgi:hypothetical protein
MQCLLSFPLQIAVWSAPQLIDVEIFEYGSSSSGRFDGEGKITQRCVRVATQVMFL